MVRRWPALPLLVLCLALPSPRPANAAARSPSSPFVTLDQNGSWQEHGALADQFLPLWYDSAGDRLVALGDWEPGAHAFAFGDASGWQTLRGMPAGVLADHGNTGCDEVTGDAYVLSDDSGSQTLWHVTAGSSVTTVPVVATGPAPSPRQNALVRFDHLTQRLFVMGGVPFGQAPAAGDSGICVLQMGPTPTWSTIGPSGLPLFAGRVWSMGADLVVDEARRRLLLFGLYPDSVYALSIDTPGSWTALPVSFPQGGETDVDANALALDHVGDQVLCMNWVGQLWALSLASLAWNPIEPAGLSPGSHPHVSLAIDRTRHRLLAEGGRLPGGLATPSNELWSLSLDGAPAWTPLVRNALRPEAGIGGFGGYDSRRNRLLLFGGQWLGLTLPGLQNVWALDLGSAPTWNVLATTGISPDRSWAASAYDPVRDQLVLFGGVDANNVALADVATLSFGGTAAGWDAVTPSGSGPTARSRAAMVYDSARDRFLLLSDSFNHLVPPELWELRLSPTPAWRQMSPAGMLANQQFGSVPVYDPVNDRVIVLGCALADTLDAPTWALDLASGDGTWHKLAVSSGPSWRHGALAVYDPTRRRVLVFGGQGLPTVPYPASRSGFLNDAWALDVHSAPAWHALAPDGDMPAARSSALGAYDPANDRLVMTGGLATSLIDTWTLSFGGLPTATDVTLVAQEVASDHVTLIWDGGVPGTNATAYRRAGDEAWRSLGTLASDGLGRFTLTDRDVVPGARLEYRLGVMTDGPERFVGATIVDVPALALAMRAGLTQDHHVQLVLQLPAAGEAKLALYDVAGRRVWGRNLTVDVAGIQSVPVNASGMGPGLYFARLQWGREVRRARVALFP